MLTAAAITALVALAAARPSPNGLAARDDSCKLDTFSDDQAVGSNLASSVNQWLDGPCP